MSAWRCSKEQMTQTPVNTNTHVARSLVQTMGYRELGRSVRESGENGVSIRSKGKQAQKCSYNLHCCVSAARSASIIVLCSLGVKVIPMQRIWFVALASLNPFSGTILVHRFSAPPMSFYITPTEHGISEEYLTPVQCGQLVIGSSLHSKGPVVGWIGWERSPCLAFFVGEPTKQCTPIPRNM